MLHYQYKDHFTLHLNKVQINKKLSVGIFLISLLISFKSFAELKIAFIDTGFCQHQDTKNIKFEKTVDLTSSINNLNCPEHFEKFPRFHGEQVLQTFLASLKTEKKITIFPLIVFNAEGVQKISYWEKAIKVTKDLKVDLIISATGIKLLEKENIKIEANKMIWYLAAARISPMIKRNDQIFPQNLKDNNIYLFGVYDEGNYIDPGQIDIERIKLFTKNSMNKFNGSSYGLPVIAAEIISNCDDLKISPNCIDRLPKSIKNLVSLKR